MDEVDGMTLDRRDFVLQSVKFGTALGVSSALLPAVACDMAGAPPVEGQLGEYTNPYTREDPGEWADKVEIHQPVLYAAPVGGGLTRFWVEVRDAAADVSHEQQQDHFVDQIVLTDEFGNIIGNAAFQYSGQARVITTVAIPEGVTQIYCYEHCNLHGWWRAIYNVADIPAEPAGDFRRPLTEGAPGRWADKIPVHIPYIGVNPDGYILVEIGSRADETLHEMTPEHYIDKVLVFDQNGQLVERATLSPGQEASVRLYNIGDLQASDYWRIVASCNLHDWWEAVYTTR